MSKIHCSKCGKPKDPSEFNKCAHNKSGLNGQCKKCVRAYKNTWRQKQKLIKPDEYQNN